MSETSRSRVTITLGRTGQVVKRDGSSFDSSYTHLRTLSGTKRSVRERLGNNLDPSAQHSNKRMRGDGRAVIDTDDINLSKDDLRYKIIQKKIRKQSQNRLQRGVDLRDILSRPAQSSTNSVSAWDKIREPTDARARYLEPKDNRQHIPGSDRQLMSVTRSSSHHLPPVSKVQQLLNPRVQHVSDAREVGRISLKPKDGSHHMDVSRSSMISDVSGQRAANTVSKMEPGINSYSPWTLDPLRRRSPPYEAWTTSRSLAPPIRDEESQRRYAARTLGDSRSRALTYKDAYEFPRPTSSSSYLTKMAPPVGQMKTTAPIAPARSFPSIHSHNASYMVDDRPTVDIFFRSLGLEKFAILFKAEEVDMYSLERMTDSDLKELGIPMGPRKKILLALQSRLKRQA